MKGRLICGLVLVLAACESPVTTSQVCPDSPFASHPSHATYSALLASYCAASRSPGCAVAVDRPGEPLWIGAIGTSNLTSAAPMCIGTPLRIGSVSKTYVAAIAMRLVEDGILAFDQSLAATLPETRGRIPSADVITVEQLLSHRSGILNPESQNLFAQTDYFDRADDLIPLTLVQRLERYVYDRPLLFAPGSAQRYFNPGYDLLGLMAERASGETLQQLTARLILQPLALSHSSFENRDDPACARGYAFTSEGLLLDVTEEDKANVNGFSPSGGMVATIGDVQAMFRALFGGRIINQTSLDMMTRGEGTIRSGLFFTPSESGREAYGHQGALIGESTRALYFPNLDAIVVGTQNSNGRTDDVALLNRFLD